MRKTLAFFVLLSVGCTEDRRWTEIRHERACTTDAERKALADAIIACSAAANPKSDEEGEDLVAQCERSMQNAVCPERRVMFYMRSGNQGAPYDQRVLP